MILNKKSENYWLILLCSLRGSVGWNNCHKVNFFVSFCRSLRGSVGWNTYNRFCFYIINCRSLRGSVGWNLIIYDDSHRHLCRSLRGSVGWNLIVILLYLRLIVAPFVGVWVEIAKTKGKAEVRKSLPSWECGLKSAILLLCIFC